MGDNINQTPKRDTFSLFQASFFGRGGGAGAMFRRGMSTLLRVQGEGDSPAQGWSNCKCPAGKLLALFH